MDQVTERSLDASIRDVACYGVMLGLGEAYLSAYAIHLGASDPILALLACAPPFLGALAQLWSARLLDRRPKRRPQYLGGAILQLLTWPVIVGSIWLPKPLALQVLIGAVMVYFAGLYFSTPAWSSTMGDLVPHEIRGRYFAWRGRTAIFCQWLGTILAGYGLHVFEQNDRTHWGFSLIFAGAFVARLASVIYLGRMTDPEYRPRREDYFSLADFLRVMPRSNFAKFVLYVSAMSLATHVSAPYFSRYMLVDLNFSYTQFMIAQAILVAGHVIQLFTWGPLCDRFGNKRVLAVSGMGITLVPLLWVMNTHALSIYAVQFLAGASWSGFNLSAANFILDAVTPAKRARCMAFFTLFNASGILLGGVLGAMTIGRITFWTPFYVILLSSFVLRLLTQVLFLPRFNEVRPVAPISTLSFVLRATHLKSVADLTMDVLAGDRGEEEPPP